MSTITPNSSLKPVVDLPPVSPKLSSVSPNAKADWHIDHVTYKDLGSNNAPKPPASVTQITPTVFQLTPFAELKKFNPYETFDLNVLTKQQLDIDILPNILASLLPPELLGYLKMVPATISELSRLKMTMEQYVSQAYSLVPSFVDFQSLLRGGISLEGILRDSQRFLGLSDLQTLMDMPSFYTNGMLEMTNMASVVDVNRYADMIATDNASGISSPDYVASTAVALSYIHSNVDTQDNGSTIKMLNESTIATPSDILPLVNVTSGRDISALSSFLTKVSPADMVSYSAICNSNPAISNAITTLTQNVVTLDHPVLVAVIAASTKYGTPTVKTLTDLLNIDDVATQETIDLGEQLGYDKMATISSVYTAIGKAGVNAVLNALMLLPNDAAIDFITEVNALGVAGYIALHGNAGMFGPLLAIINTYGLDVVTDISRVYNGGASYDQMQDGLDLTKILGTTNIVKLMTVAASFGATDVKATLTQLNGLNKPQLAIVITDVDIIGVDDIQVVLNILTATSVAEINTITEIITGVPSVVLIKSLTTISNLTDDELTTLTTYMDSIDPYLTLTKQTAPAELLAYAVRTACKIAAKKGNFNIIAKLLKNYTGEITMSYRKYLVTELLANYKLNITDSAIGITTTAICLSHALYNICPTWDLIDRAGNTIVNHTPWVTASDTTLDILKWDDRTAVAAIIQKQARYK